jgi:hypothetical protein
MHDPTAVQNSAVPITVKSTRVHFILVLPWTKNHEKYTYRVLDLWVSPVCRIHGPLAGQDWPKHCTTCSMWHVTMCSEGGHRAQEGSTPRLILGRWCWALPNFAAFRPKFVSPNIAAAE